MAVRVDSASVEGLRRAMKVPGLAVAVLSEGEVHSVGAAGLASLAPKEEVTARTRFQLYSVTKLITAVAVLQQVEAGAIDLDAGVSRYLPKLILGARPTVLELLCHRSGYGREAASFSFHFLDEPRGDPDRLLEQMVAKGAGGQPGGQSRYSNVNYALLAAVVEKVSGQPFEEYVRARILVPLGMHDTSFAAAGAAHGHLTRWSMMHWMSLWAFSASRRSRLYPRTIDGWMELQPFELDGKGYGGLVGSISDLITFLRFHVDESPVANAVLSAAGRKRMREAGEGPFACGWSRWSVDGRAAYGHLGGGPGFVSYVSLVPALRAGVALLGNAFSRQLPDVSSLLRAR